MASRWDSRSAGAARFGNGDGTDVALGGLNLLVGGFITPRWALVFDAVGVNYGPYDSRLKNDFGANIAGTYGVAAQFWLNDRVNFTGGIGAGIKSIKTIEGVESNRAGLGLILGARVLPLAFAHHGVGFYFDVAPIFTSDENVLTYQGGIAWQWY